MDTNERYMSEVISTSLLPGFPADWSSIEELLWKLMCWRVAVSYQGKEYEIHRIWDGWEVYPECRPDLAASMEWIGDLMNEMKRGW